MNTDELFAAEIHEKIIAEAAEKLSGLAEADASKAATPQAAAMIHLVQSLSSDDREVLRMMMEQEAVDTAASLLSVIQGQSILDSFDSDFRLTYGSDDIGKDVLTNFLVYDEQSRPWVVG